MYAMVQNVCMVQNYLSGPGESKLVNVHMFSDCHPCCRSITWHNVYNTRRKTSLYNKQQTFVYRNVHYKALELLSDRPLELGMHNLRGSEADVRAIDQNMRAIDQNMRAIDQNMRASLISRHASHIFFYSGTPPYGHPVNTASSFWPGEITLNLLYKNPFNTATS